jgi:N4-gp56 family major capsid protein
MIGQTTTGGQASGTIQTYYRKQLLEWARPKYVFYEYAQKVPVPKNNGASVRFNRPVSLGVGYIVTEGAGLSTPKALSTTAVSALLETLGDSISVTKLFSRTTILDIYDYATKILADQAANTLNRYAVMALLVLSEGTVSTNNYIKDGYAISSGVVPYLSSQTAMSMVSAAAKLALSDLRSIRTQFERLNVPKFDGNMPYKAFMHPSVIDGLMADTSWATWHAYTDRAAFEKGAVGNAFGFEIYQTTTMPISAGNVMSTNSGWAYGSLFFGREAWGATELEALNFYTVDGPEKLDPTNNAMVFAWDITTAVKLLNVSSIIWSWTGIQTDRTTDVSANITSPATYVGA